MLENTVCFVVVVVVVVVIVSLFFVFFNTPARLRINGKYLKRKRSCLFKYLYEHTITVVVFQSSTRCYENKKMK